MVGAGGGSVGGGGFVGGTGVGGTGVGGIGVGGTGVLLGGTGVLVRVLVGGKGVLVLVAVGDAPGVTVLVLVGVRVLVAGVPLGVPETTLSTAETVVVSVPVGVSVLMMSSINSPKMRAGPKNSGVGELRTPSPEEFCELSLRSLSPSPRPPMELFPSSVISGSISPTGV